MVGLNFTDEAEANHFYESIKQKIDKRQRKSSKCLTIQYFRILLILSVQLEAGPSATGNSRNIQNVIQPFPVASKILFWFVEKVLKIVFL